MNYYNFVFIDDKKCRIWDAVSGEVAMVLPLSSPGRNILWNVNDPNKVISYLDIIFP